MSESSPSQQVVASWRGDERPQTGVVSTAPWREVVIATAAALPFAAGRLAGGAVTGEGSALAGHVLCPFRAATGVPCPLCGATRSVVLFSQGDVAFLRYNPVWVAVLLTVVAIGVGLAVAGPAVRARLLRRRPAVIRVVAGACLAVGWACSLLHRQAIAGA